MAADVACLLGHHAVERQFERQAIGTVGQIAERAKNNVCRANRLLGLTRLTMRYHLEKHKIGLNE